MAVFGIVYLQYWVQKGHDVSFRKHLNILKEHYYCPKKMTALEQDPYWVSVVINLEKLNEQASLFMLSMKRNYVCNDSTLHQESPNLVVAESR